METHILSHSMKFILKENKKYSFLLVSFWEKFYIIIFSKDIKSCEEEKNWIVPYLFYLFKKNEFRFMPLEISMRHLEVVSVVLIVLMDKRLRITFYENVTNWTMVAFCTWIEWNVNAITIVICFYSCYLSFTSRISCNKQPILTKKRRGEIYLIKL